MCLRVFFVSCQLLFLNQCYGIDTYGYSLYMNLLVLFVCPFQGPSICWLVHLSHRSRPVHLASKIKVNLGKKISNQKVAAAGQHPILKHPAITPFLRIIAPPRPSRKQIKLIQNPSKTTVIPPFGQFRSVFKLI
ncbi:hypothetical protein GGI42DRAFT_323308 [Trichoderma sp. SZMC 28013]